MGLLPSAVMPETLVSGPMQRPAEVKPTTPDPAWIAQTGSPADSLRHHVCRRALCECRVEMDQHRYGRPGDLTVPVTQ